MRDARQPEPIAEPVDRSARHCYAGDGQAHDDGQSDGDSIVIP